MIFVSPERNRIHEFADGSYIMHPSLLLDPVIATAFLIALQAPAANPYRGLWTDWGAANDRVEGIRAGVDLEMPGPGRAYGPHLAAAVRAGEVDEKLVDAQVARLLSVFDRLGALDGGDPGDDVSTDAPEHRAVARRAATESMVMASAARIVAREMDSHTGRRPSWRVPVSPPSAPPWVRGTSAPPVSPAGPASP